MKIQKLELNRVIQTLIAAIVVFLLITPILVMISTSLKTYTDTTMWPPKWIPENIQWKNYYDVTLGEKSILKSFVNSLVVASATSLICISAGSIASYSVTRFNFMGRKVFLFVIIATQMFSAVILVNPMYVTFRELGLLNTRLALILANTASSLPMTVWLVYSYMSAIPSDMEEAAMIDGCSRFQSIYKVLIPIVRPGLITAGLFSFIAAWGDLIYAQSFITRNTNARTLSLALTDFQSLYKTSWETQMAASVISIIPVFIIFVLIQKHLVKGIASGGVKE